MRRSGAFSVQTGVDLERARQVESNLIRESLYLPGTIERKPRMNIHRSLGRASARRSVVALVALAAVTFFTGAVSADDSAALASLRALAANEQAAVAPELASVSFKDATYLVDGLTYIELIKLRKHLDNYAIDLPANIAGAIRAKTPNAGTSRRNR
jgi:hypothetical protein